MMAVRGASVISRRLLNVCRNRASGMCREDKWPQQIDTRDSVLSERPEKVIRCCAERPHGLTA